jgi:hypothetical protein
MEVRIIKRATGTVDGVALRKYTPGEVYDVSSTLADYLILQGFARPEMRRPNRTLKLRKLIDRRMRMAP